jgi:hypothetical protein
MKICREIPKFGKIGQTYQARYMNSQVRFVVAADTHPLYTQFFVKLNVLYC